jgi:hypothetical protein
MVALAGVTAVTSVPTFRSSNPVRAAALVWKRARRFRYRNVGAVIMAGLTSRKKANPGRYVPRHFVRRVAPFLVLRAAVRQRQPLKFPAPVLPRAVLSLPGKVATSASQASTTELQGVQA